MSLQELSAQQLARIDSLSMEFERWLTDLLEKEAAWHSEVEEVDPQESEADQFARQPSEQRFLKPQDVDSKIDSLVSELANDSSLDAHHQLLTETLREELQAVAAELIRPPSTFSGLHALQPSNALGSTAHAPTTALAADSTGQNSPQKPAQKDSAKNRVSVSPADADTTLLQPGIQLGPYLIDQLIGRGGMGEVYRGRDTRLGREVAIKILINAWANTPEHSDRFDREARAVAALSHPSIVSLYDVGHHAGRPYAVMELLKGETLRDRLRSSAPLPPAEVRRIGAAASDALAVAHQANIIHRDLKPENLFLTNDGRVKLLDFGLSRAYNDSAASSDPTMTGVIMGTMGYLSPEQAAGNRITKAADLFSLGCVLHECFYGFRPFSGETTNEVLAATINAIPRIDTQRVALDRNLADLIAQCLEKDPELRPESAGSLAKKLISPQSLTEPNAQLGASIAGQRDSSEQVGIENAHSEQALSERATASDPGFLSRRVSTQAMSTKNKLGQSGSLQTPSPQKLDGQVPASDQMAGYSPAKKLLVAEQAAPSAPMLNRRRWMQGMGIAAASLAGAGALYGGVRWIYPRAEIRSIAVLPLSNTGPRPGAIEGMELRGLDEGEEIAAAIADQLTRIPDLRVVPFLPLREATKPAENLASPDTVRKLCDSLGVDALLMGSFDIDEDGFRTIKVRLIEGRKGSQVGRYQIRARREENLIAQQETAERVAEGIGRELLAYRSGRMHENHTYHCLVNGYSRMDSESVEALRDAIKCFQHAIDQDEKFAEAYSGLALTSMILASQVSFTERTELISGAREALRSAIELGDNTGQPRIAESMLAWQVDWDFRKADELFRRYVPQMPDSWVAQHEYAFFLAAQGDLPAALRHAERAVGIDPTSTAFRVDAARLRWFAGDWQTALAELRSTAGKASGKRLELVRGATLDLLESVGMWDEASALLLGTQGSFSQEGYWQAREASLKDRPYGPYDDELNLLILRLRRGDQLDEASLNEIKVHRPPRLPFLLAAHPTLAPLRNAKAFQEALL